MVRTDLRSESPPDSATREYQSRIVAVDLQRRPRQPASLGRITLTSPTTIDIEQRRSV
jgi:hypothetical protein